MKVLLLFLLIHWTWSSAISRSISLVILPLAIFFQKMHVDLSVSVYITMITCTNNNCTLQPKLWTYGVELCPHHDWHPMKRRPGTDQGSNRTRLPHGHKLKRTDTCTYSISRNSREDLTLALSMMFFQLILCISKNISHFLWVLIYLVQIHKILNFKSCLK